MSAALTTDLLRATLRRVGKGQSLTIALRTAAAMERRVGPAPSYRVHEAEQAAGALLAAASKPGRSAVSAVRFALLAAMQAETVPAEATAA